MLKKVGANVVSVMSGGRSFLLPLMWCVALLSAVGAINYPPLAGAQGVESQGAESLSVPAADQGGVDSYTKLMLHADGSDQGTSFTDSSSGAKTVTNTESYDSYTKLMLHIEGSDGSTTFTDSATGKSVTTSGNAQIDTAQSKLGTASGLFDAYPDRLQSADSNDWSFGTGDFTVDFWVRFSSFAGESQQHFVSQYDASYPNTYWSIHYSVSGALNMHFYDGVLKGSYRADVVLNTNTWYHLAFERYGSGAKIFVNGVSQTLVEDNAFGTNDVGNANAPLSIGDRAGWGYILRGWIDELRISKGIARWTSNFTPPSSPYGKVATVTSQKKFGTASGEFHGSGDYLSLSDSDDWNFGSGDFTIDFWVRFNSLVGGNQSLFAQHTDGTHFYNCRVLDNAGSLQLDFYVDSPSIISYSQPYAFVINTWYHIALVRYGSSFMMFVNGVSLGTLTNSVTIPNYTGTLRIGARDMDDGWPLNGWLDELRISKGIARWTSDFTPPSAPYETDTTPPTVSSISPASSATGVGVSSAISATFSEDMDSSTISTSTFTLSSSSGSSVSGTVSYSNKVATFTPSSNLSYSTTYTATITTGVKDVAGNAMSSTYTWSFTTSSAPDTTAPTGSVSGASYTNLSTVTLTLSATDNVGVTGYYLSDSSTIPSASASGWTSVTSTTSYSGTVSYSLSGGEGSKTIYAWYKDAAGNVSSTANATITYDTTAPTVTISSPTSSSTYTSTSSTISLGGSASDSTSGISSVAWSNSKGGSGTASGTASWTISSISLSSGDNIITVTAKDGAGNTNTDTITITYSAATKPTVTTGSATNVTATQATLTGTVNANGLSTTAWFEYSTISGSYTNKSSTQTVTGSNDTTVSITISGLTSGTTYYYRIAAQNNSGTSYGSEMSFQYNPGGSAPTVTTDAATDVTTTTATLTGTVNANGISTTAWFEYGAQSGSYGNKTTTKSVSGSTDTKVGIGISGLTANTTYYYRIVAQNSVGTSYGKEMSFYAQSQINAPTVTTESATNVTDTSATLNGKVNPNGLSTTAWFEYGTSELTYDYKTSTQSLSGSTYTSVSASITGLTAGTTYYYRLGAKNSGGTSYGDEMFFYKSPGTNATPTPTATPVPTLPPVPTQPPGGGCFNKGSISIQSIDPPKGTVLEAGKTYTFTMTVKYEFDEPTTGYIVSFAYDADTYNDLDGLVDDQINVSSQTGEETISVTTKPSYYGNPVRGIYVAVSLVGKGFNCSDVVDNIKYTVNDAASTTPVPTPPPVPGGNGIIFGFVNSPDGDPLQYVTVTLAGNGFSQSIETDGDGYYEFSNLAAGDYTLTYEKEGYQTQTMEVSLEEGEALEVSTITMEEIEKGKISGYVLDIKGEPIESVRIKLKGLRTKVITTKVITTDASDADGFFEFTDLDEDTYIITTKKRGYRKNKKTVKLEGGESKEIEIELRKTTKRIKGLFLMEDVQ